MPEAEHVLYPVDKPRFQDAHVVPTPKTLAEALSLIRKLTKVIHEYQMSEDVAVQGRVAAHLGVSGEHNPYHELSRMHEVWDDAFQTEHEFYVTKDRLLRVGDLVIAACAIKNNPGDERAKRVFDIALARVREQTGI